MNEMSMNQQAVPATFPEAELSEAKRQLLQQYLNGALRKSTPEWAGVRPRSPQEPIPLSLAQQQVWLHAQMANDVPFYNEPITVYRRGPLDADVLEQCFLEITRRHEIWRTTFDILAGEPVQIVQPPPTAFPVPVVDLRGLPEAEREAEAKRLATADVRRPFDLRTGPLLRALVICMDDEQYRLYVTVHQIAFDAVTVYRVFLPELTTLYQAFASGKASPLPELPIQYRDFSEWQRKRALSEGWAEHASYWRNTLVDAPTLQWPNDRPRPPIETHRGAIARYVLPADLVRDLRSLSQRNGVSLYMILLATFATLLHRYTGQDDLVVGTFTGARKLAEFEPLLGYFVNPLALRIDLSGNPAFLELLFRVREVVLDALKHDEIPFAHVVKESRCRPDPSRNPLFQMVLSQQPKLPPLAPGWDVATEEICNGGSKLDLVIVLDDRGDDIFGPITYNPDVFDAATIQRMVEHWQTLIAAVSANPEMCVANLPLLTDQERRKILVDWNDTAAEFQENGCLHQLIEAQVKRTPDAAAVIYEREQGRLSYRELNARANQLANHLRKFGVGPDVRVGICLDRSPQMVVGLLGILKAGGAYVPLDPEYPKERLAFMIQDSGLQFLITQESLDIRLGDCGGRRIYIDRDWPRISQESAENPSIQLESQNLAYVIYTSGSTGKPKGVQICHRALINFLTSMQARPGLTQNDRILAVTTISFDIAALELYLPLTVGACCVVASRETAADGRQLCATLLHHDITVMQATPSTWKLLLDSEWPGNPNLKILCGGEALSRDLAKELTARASSVWNMYGPTETTVWSAAHPVTSSDDLIFIGRPIANTTMYVLDRNLQPVPLGAVGELYIGGDGLARGYLNRPELDAEKFIPNPFEREPGARIYRTGDLARYRTDGNIECLGRTDTQVKIRGFRIELDEIESVLREHPAVGDACVIVREDTPGDPRLLAYVTPLQSPASLNDMRSFLKERLPNHMIPILSSQDRFPLTPNGKLDRRALPPIEPTNCEEEPVEELRDPIEQLLAGIWTETLKVQRVSVYDNFFDLGGHSLLATQVVTRLEKELGLRVKAKELAFQTLGQFAASCRQRLCNK